tara:strand:- start:1015 stop:1410 length:396 start_codon:yes stop_codon:yes gene_type:complete
MEIEKYEEQKERIVKWLESIEDDSMAISLLTDQCEVFAPLTDKARKKHMDGLKTLLNMSGRTDLPSVTRSRGPHREEVYALSTEIEDAAMDFYAIVGQFMHKHDSDEEYAVWVVKNLAEGNHRHHTTTKGA